MTEQGWIHPCAIIGDPPEHRDCPPLPEQLVPEIDPSARINSFVTVDAGISEPTRVGARSFLMTKTHVGHDAQVGADCELAPGTVIGGHAVLDDGVRCGIGVMVKPGVRVGAGARLGAGAVVVKDVPAGEVWVGNPARKLGDLDRTATALITLAYWLVQAQSGLGEKDVRGIEKIVKGEE